jgi:putative MATE family efflux protein
MQQLDETVEKSDAPAMHQTKGVETLLGDPKKAIIKLSIPMIAAVLSHTIYNLTDAIWVSGKGPASLSAVGFTFPFLFMAMSIANGIGIGSGAAISRRIGAGDKSSADSVASHAIVIMLIIVFLFTGAMIYSARPLMHLMGAGEALDLAVTYARIMFLGLILIFFMQTASAILRSEGDAKRAMYVMLAGSLINIILDPIFIYTLGLGVAGAAWATLLSMSIVSLIAFYWLFIEKKTFVSFKFRGFRFDNKILADIGKVGVPASVSQMSMALMAFSLTKIIALIGGPDGVAVYTTGWRVSTLATLPMLGVASAVTSVTAAAFGARDYKKMEISFLFALKTGVLVESVLAVLTFLFASQITWIFTWSEETARIIGDLTQLLRVVWIFFPTVAVGMLSTAMFQGAGKGLTALIMTILRTLVFTVPCVWFFGIVLEGGLLGVWNGLVVSGLIYVPIAFGWATSYLRKLKGTMEPA